MLSFSSEEERKEFIQSLGVDRVSVGRWLRGEASPRTWRLQGLFKAIPPAHRQAMLAALQEAFPDFLPDAAIIPETGNENGIPSIFYQVIKAYRDFHAAERFQNICTSVLQSCLSQIDPSHLGMELVVAQCLPPGSDGKIHSLRERVGVGTYPWQNSLYEKKYYFGVESFGGYALSIGKPIIQGREECPFKLFNEQLNRVQSIGAFPIMRAGEVAGVFLLYSCTPSSFFTHQVLQTIDAYTMCINLAFDEFYDVHHIALNVMPDVERQLPILAGLAKRIASTMVHSAQHGEHLSPTKAEIKVLSEIEEELLVLGRDPLCP